MADVVLHLGCQLIGLLRSSLGCWTTESAGPGGSQFGRGGFSWAGTLLDGSRCLLMIDRNMVNSARGGALMDKTPATTRHFISYMFGIRGGVVTSRVVSEVNVFDNLRLDNQLMEITSLVRQLTIGQHQQNTQQAQPSSQPTIEGLGREHLDQARGASIRLELGPCKEPNQELNPVALHVSHLSRSHVDSSSAPRHYLE
ncbi:hypothetical protein CR513_01976, partial [Mucuna pruriens]